MLLICDISKKALLHDVALTPSTWQVLPLFLFYFSIGSLEFSLEFPSKKGLKYVLQFDTINEHTKRNKG